MEKKPKQNTKRTFGSIWWRLLLLLRASGPSFLYLRMDRRHLFFSFNLLCVILIWLERRRRRKNALGICLRHFSELITNSSSSRNWQDSAWKSKPFRRVNLLFISLLSFPLLFLLLLLLYLLFPSVSQFRRRRESLSIAHPVLHSFLKKKFYIYKTKMKYTKTHFFSFFVRTHSLLICRAGTTADRQTLVDFVSNKLY